MGFFSRLFGGGKKENEKGDRKEIYFADNNQLMIDASKNAQNNFKYIWRQLY